MVQFCVEAGLVLLLSFGTMWLAGKHINVLCGGEKVLFLWYFQKFLSLSLKYFQTVSRSHQVEQFGFRVKLYFCSVVSIGRMFSFLLVQKFLLLNAVEFSCGIGLHHGWCLLLWGHRYQVLRSNHIIFLWLTFSCSRSIKSLILALCIIHSKRVQMFVLEWFSNIFI